MFVRQLSCVDSLTMLVVDGCYQIEIQRMLAHAGLNDANNKQIVSLLSLIVQTSWDGQHSCTDVTDCVTATCSLCEFSLLWYQLSTNVLQFIVPASESPVPVQDVPDVGGLLEARAASAKNAAGKRRDVWYWLFDSAGNLRLLSCCLYPQQADVLH